MSEDMNFQNFGVKAPSTHVIDPSVATEIGEALMKNQKGLLTGILFGAEEEDNLLVSNVLITSIGEIEDRKFTKAEGLESLIKYYQRVYSQNVVGWLSNKVRQ
jgi:hypothetical protein